MSYVRMLMWLTKSSVVTSRVLDNHRHPVSHRLLDCRVDRLLGGGGDYQAVDSPHQKILDIGHLLVRTVVGIGARHLGDLGVLGCCPLGEVVDEDAGRVRERSVRVTNDPRRIGLVLGRVLHLVGLWDLDPHFECGPARCRVGGTVCGSCGTCASRRGRIRCVPRHSRVGGTTATRHDDERHDRQQQPGCSSLFAHRSTPPLSLHSQRFL